ncbi:porin [Pasteurella atlantica]|uniref:Porin n=2 Tax=Pasteurellaceae TaxID=712 RepID=A0ACC6HMT5_9PAST|nr:porin [Pasteurella atlantica]MDP8051941.1 porin [Pasteurella atlantica]MDP8105387.1 porin [Pasteurella atlantica]MDP8148720.1 porin [Pasteurella atlantica]
MKKTLVALTVAALTATSASALTVFEENGSTIKVGGAVKLSVQKESLSKGTIAKRVAKDGAKADVGKKTKMRKHDAKINVEAKYAFGDAYALGFYEYDFLGSTAKKAYVGLGNNAGHQVTFGLQNTFADNVGESSFDNIWGVRKKFLSGDADNSIAYRFTGLENWEFGADYVLKTQEFAGYNAAGEVVFEENKAAFDLGAKYSANDLTVGFAYGHQKKTNAFDLGLAYQMDNLTFAFDVGYLKMDKTKAYYVSPGMKAAFGDAAVYGNYNYYKSKTGDAKTKKHGFNLGTEYQLVKNAKVFAEFNYVKVKDADKADKAFGVGMKVEW